MSEEEKYVSVEPEEIEIKDYMDDVEFVISTPESYDVKEVPTSSNVTYQHVYVSVS